MDQQFIELEHRDNVKALMQICSINMEQAYNLYMNSDYNLQVAINNKINPPSHKRQSARSNNFMNSSITHSNLQEDVRLKQYRLFIEKGESFDIKYQFRNQSRKKQVDYMKKKSNKLEEYMARKQVVKEKEEPSIEKIKKQLQQFIQIRTNLKIQSTSIKQALYSSWKQRFPIAILFFNFSTQIKPSLKAILADKYIVEQVFNKFYKLCCIQINEIQLQKWLQPYINAESDQNHLIISRVNCRDQIEIVKKISLAEVDLQRLKEDLKQAKTESIQRQLDQMHIVKEFNEIRKGNRNYQRPKAIKQKLMMRQDMKLKRQQDQAFYKACAAKKDQKNPEENSNKIKISKEIIKKERQQKFSKLIKYQTGLLCKIRFPSGQNKYIIVPQNQSIDYLFKYIQFLPQEIGFESDQVRYFDILKTEQPKSLKGKRNMLIKQILQQNEMLQVKQLQKE